VDWYGAGGSIRVWHGLTRAQAEMRNAYLHRKALFTICPCGLILQADRKRELATERRRHRLFCVCINKPDHWSVAA
jgi:hypothetical protein